MERLKERLTHIWLRWNCSSVCPEVRCLANSHCLFLLHDVLVFNTFPTQKNLGSLVNISKKSCRIWSQSWTWRATAGRTGWTAPQASRRPACHTGRQATLPWEEAEVALPLAEGEALEPSGPSRWRRSRSGTRGLRMW